MSRPPRGGHPDDHPDQHADDHPGPGGGADRRAPTRAALEDRVLAEQAAVQHLALRSGLDELLSLPLTIVQLKCLLVVLAEGSSTGRALGAALGLSAPTVSGVVDRLVAAGYLQRRDHPDDRRMVLLEATPRSQAWADGIARTFQARSARLTARLGDDELHHLAVGTAALRRELEREADATPGRRPTTAPTDPPTAAGGTA